MRRHTRNRRISTARGGISDRVSFSLMVHGPEFGSGEELVINPECFPDVKINDVLEISQPEREHTRLVLQVTSLTPVRGKLQISILKEVAAQFGLDAFHNVVVQKVDSHDVMVDFIELSFKDQFLSRADLWRFKVAMYGKCVYVGKNMETLGVRSQVEALLANHRNVECGVMGAETKLIVRSRSSRLFWLVQMTPEMWEFALDGELYYEKLLNRLLRELIVKWGETMVSHSVTIIAFSRNFYDKSQFPPEFNPAAPLFSEPNRQGFGPGCEATHSACGYGPSIQIDPHSGQYYEDFYKVLVMNYSGTDWNHLVGILKHEFAHYPAIHRWRTSNESIPAQYEICENTDHNFSHSMPSEVRHDNDNFVHRDNTNITSGEIYVKWISLPYGVPARAASGNLLEAINVTLNILDKHYMDRDLNRTGQSIVMVTAGSGVFHVNERLAQITKQRMMDNGVGMDMISLATPPLHIVPLFVCRRGEQHPDNHPSQWPSPVHSVTSPSKLFHTPTSTKSMDHTKKLYHGLGSVSYIVPHWVNVTFLDFDCRCNPKTSSLRSSSYSRNLSHRTYICKCQDTLNKKFLPLPPFRIFKTVSVDKSTFPVSLARMMKNRRSPGCQLPNSTLWKTQGHDDTSHVQTSNRIPELVPLKCHLARAPDFELNTRHSIFSQNECQASVREALNAYDDSVFMSIRVAPPVSPRRHHSYSSNLMSPSGGLKHANTTHDWDCTSPPSPRWKSRSVHGGNVGNLGVKLNSVALVNSILSPRNDLAVRRGVEVSMNTRQLSLQRMSGGTKKPPIFLSEKADIGFADSAQSPHAVVPFQPRLGRSKSIESTHDFSRESKWKASRVHRHVATTSGRTDPTNIDKHRVLTPGHRANTDYGFNNNGDTSSPKNLGIARSMTMSKIHTPHLLSSDHTLKSPPPRHRVASLVTSSPERLISGSYQKSHFLTGQGMIPSTRRYSSEATLNNSHSHVVGGVATSAVSTDGGINPFKYSNDTVESATAQLTSDRRRWNHLFPLYHSTTNLYTDNDKVNDHQCPSMKQIYLGPNWKSLVSPAILPLTTDYYPNPKDLYTRYTESFYTLTLPSSNTNIFPKYRNHDELLIEMVCQRLAGDFQLVARETSTDVETNRHKLSSAIVLGPSGESHDSQSNTTTYHLSMGHRIHQILYDAQRQTIEVKRYIERESQSQLNEPTVYRYSLWVDKTQAFQPLQQKFYEYPMPEENWNALDHILCGYEEEITDLIKCRRIRFAIVPPTSVASETDIERTIYIERFTKFQEYLQSRISSESGLQEKIKVTIVEDKQKPAFMQDRHPSLLSYKICCSSSAAFMRSKTSDTRQEWVMIRMEDMMDIHKNYHFDIRWLACSGTVVDDVISTIRRKAKQIGIELKRVPEYVSISYLQIHPLVAPTFLPMPLLIERDEDKILVTQLVELGFVLDEERVANAEGIGYGLGLGKEPPQPRKFGCALNKEVRRLEVWCKRGYRQFMHRQAPVFVRVIRNGIVWIPGYDYDQLSTEPQLQNLFKSICKLIEVVSTVNTQIATRE